MVCGEKSIYDNRLYGTERAHSQRETLRKTKFNIVNFMNLRRRSVKVKFIESQIMIRLI